MDGSTAMKIFSMSVLFWAFSKKFIIPFSRYFVTFRFGPEGICEKVFSNACAALSSDLFPQLHMSLLSLGCLP